MKQNLFFTSLVITSAVLLISAEKSVAQDKKVKEEKHIKIVTVDSKGKKVELDTIVSHGNVFIWNGDTIGNKKEIKWQPRKGIRMDSIHITNDHKFEYEITEGDNGKVIIMKGNKSVGPMVYGFSTDGDSTRQVTIMQHKGQMPAEPMHSQIRVGKSGKGPIEVQGYPLFPQEQKARRMKDKKQSNKIDLSDPGIISYEKKKLSGGREKIVIIRNEVKNEDFKVVHDGDKVIRIRENAENGGKTIDVNVETKELKK